MSSFLLASAKKDLARRMRDPLAFLLWLGIPLAIGSLMGFAFGGFGGKEKLPRAQVLVADEDESFLSKLVVGAFGQDLTAGLFEVETVAAGEGRARMEEGEASALLVIPDGFGEAVFEQTPIELALLTNPSQRILPGMIEETLAMLVEAVFYLQRLLGTELREIAEGPGEGSSVFADFAVANMSVRINRKVERLQEYLFPPALELETAERVGEEEESSGAGFAALFFPSMLFMTLFFMAQGLSDDVWKERALGTLRRVVSTPQSLVSFLLGKLASCAAMLLAVGTLAMVGGMLAFSVAPARTPLALVWVVATGTVLTAMMMLIQLFATSQRAGGLLTNVILFPLVMIGGAFFPFEAMPEWMAAIGKQTPNGWALEQLKALLAGKADAGSILLAFALLILVGAALTALCALRLRRGFAQA